MKDDILRIYEDENISLDKVEKKRNVICKHKNISLLKNENKDSNYKCICKTCLALLTQKDIDKRFSILKMHKEIFKKEVKKVYTNIIVSKVINYTIILYCIFASLFLYTGFYNKFETYLKGDKTFILILFINGLLLIISSVLDYVFDIKKSFVLDKDSEISKMLYYQHFKTDLMYKYALLKKRKAENLLDKNILNRSEKFNLNDIAISSIYISSFLLLLFNILNSK